MSTVAEAKSPSLNVLFQHVQDLSLENPTPQSFVTAVPEELETKIEIDVRARSRGEQQQYDVVLPLKIEILHKEKTVYMLDLKYAGLFEIHDVAEDMLPVFLFVHCPTLLFPYMRSLVSLLTQESGFSALNLQPINFWDLFEKRVQQQEEDSV